MIACNGEVFNIGSQFSLLDVEVVTANIDLDQIRSYRNAMNSRGVQAAQTQLVFPRIELDFDLVSAEFSPKCIPSNPVKITYFTPEQEIANGPACWLWDYLRRTGLGGYFLPLSGGADSSSTAAIVGNMCQLVFEQTEKVKNNKCKDDLDKWNAELTLKDVRALCGKDDKWFPSSHKEIASILFHTCYMGTENSSKETRQRAKDLAAEVGSYHLDLDIDIVVSSFTKLFQVVMGKLPKFKVHGGTYAENIALQNIQARSRMVVAYYFAQLLTWARGFSHNKPLLVLGSANVDEALRGYYTKYDCSAADINPIGGISKVDLKKFLVWGSANLGYPTLKSVVEAPPTAELEPLSANQVDEEDMGMTYNELSFFGRLRKIMGCGPVSMFQKLTYEWANIGAAKVAEKVKRFFFYYSINRHKMTTLTPSYHAESYSPDDNRHDLRQFLYNPKWTWQFKKIDELVAQFEQKKDEI